MSGAIAKVVKRSMKAPVAFDKLTNTATLPDYNEPGPKLEISGPFTSVMAKHRRKMWCCMSIIPIKLVIIHPRLMQKAGQNVTAVFVVG
jgi:hypothetical protein